MRRRADTSENSARRFLIERERAQRYQNRRFQGMLQAWTNFSQNMSIIAALSILDNPVIKSRYDDRVAELTRHVEEAMAKQPIWKVRRG